MASTTLRVVYPASCACAKVESFQIKDSSVRLRPALEALKSSMYCQTTFTCTSSAVGNGGRHVPLSGSPGAKWVRSALNSVEQEDVLLKGGGAVSQALEEFRQSVEQQGGDVKAADDMEILLFLPARSMDMEKAAAAFVSHQKWRAELVPNGRVTEADLPTELDAKKAFWIAQDRKGRPVILTLGRNHVYNKQDFTEFTRFLVYAVEKVIAGAPPGNQDFLSIVDLKGLGVKNLDSKSFIAAFSLLQVSTDVGYRYVLSFLLLNEHQKNAYGKCSTWFSGKVCNIRHHWIPFELNYLLVMQYLSFNAEKLKAKLILPRHVQNHYPGRIDKIFMINVPLIFGGLWTVVSKFLEEGTKKKIIFVKNKQLTETLLEEIDIDYLPKEYGGNADLVLLQDAKTCT